MGSYDRQPDDWNDYADAMWAPQHVIICNSKWLGKDRHSHLTVAEVRECYRAAHDLAAGTQVWECGWLMEGRYDDGSMYTYPCDAPARFTDDRGSHECAVGHSHIPADLRYEQGWDYAEDEFEAARLRSLGVDAVSMRGNSI